MEATDAIPTDIETASAMSVFDVAILVSLVGLGTWWVFLRKKKPEFDASSIKTFTIE